MYRMVLLLALWCAALPFVQAQQSGFIGLRGDQFIDEFGDPFYANMMIYWVDLFTTGPPLPAEPSLEEMADVRFGPFVFYTVTPEYYDYGPNDGPQTLLQDFAEIKAMGYNTIRLPKNAVKKPTGDGFHLVIKTHPVPVGNTQVEMNPPYSDDPAINPVSAAYFNMVLQVCSLANTLGMKVSVEPIEGHTLLGAAIGDPVHQDHLAFLHAFASFMHDHEVHNLLAYEFWGEPTLAAQYHQIQQSRSALCELVTTWHNTVKQADPDHLTTVGGGYRQDVLKYGWDPMIFPVDFTSIHIYPGPDPYEDHATYLLSMTERYLWDFSWYDRYLRKPYLVGENGFPGEDPYSPGGAPNPFIVYPLAVYGDEQDQDDFVRNTFAKIRDSRCAGYAWWGFHNHWALDPTADNTDPSSPNHINFSDMKDRFLGLLRFGARTSPPPQGLTGWEQHRKLAAWTFADWATNPPAPEALPAIPAAVDMNSRYFNPYLHQPNSTVYQPPGQTARYGTITGNVVDALSNPIPGAVILGGHHVGIDGEGDLIFYSYYTYTDDQGNFQLRAKDPLPENHISQSFPNPGHEQTVANLEVGAYASSWEERGWNGLAIQPSATYTLNSFHRAFDEVVLQEGVSAGEDRTFRGLATLTAHELVIAGTAAMKARYEVSLQPGFHAMEGSECHVFTGPVHLSCEEIVDADLKATSADTDRVRSSPIPVTPHDQREVDLHLHVLLAGLQLSLYPNPTGGQLVAELDRNVTDDLWELHVLSAQGQLMTTRMVRGPSAAIDASNWPAGTYTVQARVGTHREEKRFVKP